MSSQRPYLIRALLEWIADNQQTAYITVNAAVDGVQVPQNYIQNGEIVLNISNTAVRNLQVDNLFLEFDGRFGGNPITVVIPVGAVVAVYAKETGDGMVFEVESKELRAAEETELPGSHLRLVK